MFATNIQNNLPVKSQKSLVKIIFSTFTGNALEFYDFTLYGVFAVIIGKIFFPSEDPALSLLASWGAFAAGFIMRPFGAVIFGSIGDRYGRKIALSITILLMGLPTFVIGFLPSYAQIGVVAPITLVLCRLIQGLCTGGEYNGAAIFALEHSAQVKPGMIGGLITSSCVVGALLATYASFLVTSHSEVDWLWRVPFICGSLISVLGFIIRYYINESPEFIALQSKKASQRALSIINIYQTHPASSFMTFLTGALNGALSYTLFGFLNVYLTKYLGIPASVAIKYNLLGLVTYMIFSPICGFLLDCIGGYKYMTLASLSAALLCFPVFFFLQTVDPFYIILAQILLGLMAASIAGPGHAFVQKLFPTEVRYRGVSINFCLGMAVCGGTAPWILTFFIEKASNLYTPSIYIMILSLISFLGIKSLYKFNK